MKLLILDGRTFSSLASEYGVRTKTIKTKDHNSKCILKLSDAGGTLNHSSMHLFLLENKSL